MTDETTVLQNAEDLLASWKRIGRPSATAAEYVARLRSILPASSPGTPEGLAAENARLREALRRVRDGGFAECGSMATTYEVALAVSHAMQDWAAEVLGTPDDTWGSPGSAPSPSTPQASTATAEPPDCTCDDVDAGKAARCQRSLYFEAKHPGAAPPEVVPAQPHMSGAPGNLTGGPHGGVDSDAARRRLLEEMGQACVDWAKDTGECHFCDRDVGEGRPDHDVGNGDPCPLLNYPPSPSTPQASSAASSRLAEFAELVTSGTRCACGHSSDIHAFGDACNDGHPWCQVLGCHCTDWRTVPSASPPVEQAGEACGRCGGARTVCWATGVRAEICPARSSPYHGCTWNAAPCPTCNGTGKRPTQAADACPACGKTLPDLPTLWRERLFCDTACKEAYAKANGIGGYQRPTQGAAE